MAQTGMYVPAASAEISPVDGIYTHFPIEEIVSDQTGRLGDEAKRFSEIIDRVTENSLVLLNESLSSTSHSESVFVGEGFLSGLSLLGCRVVYATHLHELAAKVQTINDRIKGRSVLKSIVALVETDREKNGEVRRLYRIVPGPPEGQSYALEIARKAGVSLEQIITRLRSRNVLNNGDSNHKEKG